MEYFSSLPKNPTGIHNTEREAVVQVQLVESQNY
jgi:hypothetical protein